MTNAILTLAFFTNLLGVYLGVRSAGRSRVTGFRSVKFWAFAVIAGIAGYLADHFGPDLFAVPLKLSQSTTVVQNNAVVFAIAATVALLGSTFNGWCIGYVAGLFNKARQPASTPAVAPAPATPAATVPVLVAVPADPDTTGQQ